MARTQKRHDARKAEILQSAQELFYSKGFENTTIQDVLFACDIAKGTFYHYFSSKLDLLDSLVISLTERITEALYPIVETDQTAVEKMNGLFATTKSVKLSEPSLLVTLMEVMYRDENTLFRRKMNTRAIELLVPLYTKVIRQGISEGVFDVADPKSTSEFLLSSFLSWGETMHMYMLKAIHDPSELPLLLKAIEVTELSIHRILGAEPGIFIIYDSESINGFIEYCRKNNTHSNTGEKP